MSPRLSKETHSGSGGQSLPTLPLEKCLAKSFPDVGNPATVWEHCRLTGKIAKSLVERLPPPARKVLPDGCVALAALHDLGKVSPGFQKKIWGPRLAEVCPELISRGGFEEDHARISEVALRDWYSRHNGAAANWAMVVGLHHGTHADAFYCHEAQIFGGTSWASLRDRLLEQLIHEFGPPPVESPPKFFTFVTGLVCMADWIASDETLFPPARPLEEHLERVEEVLDRLGFLWPRPRPGLTFEEVFGFPANDIQLKTYDLADRPGLLLVEAPMGTGKTEAALWAAYRLMLEGHNHGLYFALPTRLSSNLIHHRVEGFLGKIFGEELVARLIHGQAWLEEYFRRHWEPGRRDQPVHSATFPASAEDPLKWRLGGGEEFRPGQRWFAPAKRGLLWPYGVGTVDQALLGVLQVRHYFMRLFGLAGKVVILDEIHSYDFYTGTLIESLIRTLRDLGSSVILLSGTLTGSRRESLGIKLEGPQQMAYPLISRENGVWRTPELSPAIPKVVRLRRVSPEDPDFWHHLGTCLKREAAVIWVCNTIARAQQIFRRAKECFPEALAEVALLHSQFLPWQRYEKESRWAKRLGKSSIRRGPSLLVATQVVEQSVDLDADLLITEIAPTDMLLQRIGRLWRHRRAGRPLPEPECWLIDYDCLAVDDSRQFEERLEGSAKVYAPYVLYRTARLLAGQECIDFPQQVRSLLETTYQDPQADDPPWVKVLYSKLEEWRKTLTDLALAAQDRRHPALKHEEDAVTRYSEESTKPLLIVKNVVERQHEVEVELLDNRGPLICPRGRRDPVAAARLHLNLLSVAEWFLRDIECQNLSVDALSGHLEKATCVLRWKEDGSLVTLAGQSTSLQYTMEYGLCRTGSERRSFDD